MIARKRKKASYALGAQEPQRTVEPEDGAGAALALSDAARAGETVVAYGGGTLQHAANAPARYDVALLTRRLDALHAYDPRELTAGAGAGMTLESLRRTLAEHRQFVPFDAPRADDATIGGTLAAGWAGPRRLAYGRPRDLLIGATIALPDGTLASSGGMVVKNVTGYDMGKLYVGSHGTLGVLVRANLKVLPAPAARRLAISPFDADHRARVVAHARSRLLEPSALLVIDGFAGTAADAPRDRRPRVVALFEGSESWVERAMREYRSALGAAGVGATRVLDDASADRVFQDVLDAYVESSSKASVTFLARGLPSTAAERVDGAIALGAMFRATHAGAGYGVDAIADLRTGDVVARFGASGYDATRAAEFTEAATTLRDALGGARRIAAHPSVAALVDAWGDAPSTLPIMRALKERFDPKQVLAPGRFVGGI
ncbi:MAG TPA: FAD-binding oxidoreductase [Candidatus Baltobacteraceae bacterium]|nr:FAD-binding oxidoreductase [Candidatus Baltobacteraceae bacterium]